VGALERDAEAFRPEGVQGLTVPAEPPVVARLVIEIRSDGTRTIARGAMEDHATGQSVAMRAEGTTPAALAASLFRSLLALPRLQGGHEALRRATRLLGRRRS
jgi:hypothetical protein